MPGLKISASLLLSTSQPLLANASFASAAARLALGQLRHASWRYSQELPDAHYRLQPLASCFLSNGTTPATQAGTWGSLEAHWRMLPNSADDLPESAAPVNKYYTDARAALKADRSLSSSAVRLGTSMLALVDAGQVVDISSPTLVTLTVPLNAIVAFPIGTLIFISQVSAGQVMLSPSAGVIIRQADNQFKTAKQWAEIKLRKRATDEWVLTGSTAL